MSRKPPLHAVVLAGGAGERFWPASRTEHPKPLLRVVGGRSLLDATLLRAHRFARNDRVWVVCGKEHAAELRRASGLPASRVLVEPERRNTAMAAAWISQRIAAEDPDAVMAVLPADHHIPDARAFARDIQKAANAAHQASVLVTLGVTPTRPDTGYGYIELRKARGRELRGLARGETLRREARCRARSSLPARRQAPLECRCVRVVGADAARRDRSPRARASRGSRTAAQGAQGAQSQGGRGGLSQGAVAPDRRCGHGEKPSRLDLAGRLRPGATSEPGRRSRRNSASGLRRWARECASHRQPRAATA